MTLSETNRLVAAAVALLLFSAVDLRAQTLPEAHELRRFTAESRQLMCATVAFGIWVYTEVSRSC